MAYEVHTFQNPEWSEAVKEAVDECAHMEQHEYFVVMSLVMFFDEQEGEWVVSVNGRVPDKN